MMWIKICANTNLADAALAAELGADAIGFVFAPSKRQVNAEQVAAITSRLPESLDKVGVFTTTDADEILQTATTAGLTTVQLHSSFNPALIQQIEAASEGKLRILQVVDIPEDADAPALHALLTRILLHPGITAALLDASHNGASGGTGKTFDWQTLAATVQRAQQETSGHIIIAGGLRPGNVSAAITTFQPWGVDVASGVEASYGIKDPTRLREFIQTARNATR